MNLLQIALIFTSFLPIIATLLLAYQLMRNGQGILGKPAIQASLFYAAKIGISAIFACIFLASVKNSFMLYFPWLIQNEIVPVQKLMSLIFLMGGNLLLVPAYLSLGIFTRVGIPTTAHALNTRGIYRISRNPMYTSFFFFQAGCFLLIPSILLLAIMLFISTIHHFIILKEEKYLAETFQTEYLQYKKNTARYL